MLVAWSFSAAASMPKPASMSAHPAGSTRPFTQRETQVFLTAVQKAEGIADPVRRCRAYPDPPGSHWSHNAVGAYCRNQLTTDFSFELLKARIESGQIRAVDRRMAHLLHKQLSKRGVPGALDATYETDFDNASAETRKVLDTWKRKSPHSAYAYAASGVAYVAAAQNARGPAWANDTPQSNFDAMNALLAKARHDLDRAVALNKHLIPAYAAMIRLAGLSGDDEYAQSAAKRALKSDPSDYLIYSRRIWLAQPKWGGSVDAMRRVIADAQQHTGENPLLLMLQNEGDAVAAGLDDCGCDSSDAVNVDVYRRVFDQATAKSWLGGAGLSAQDAGQNDLAVIYLSEAIRFTPARCCTDYLVSRANAFIGLGQFARAVADADRTIKINPAIKRAWTARGLAHLISLNSADAEEDFKQALKLERDNAYSLWGFGTAAERLHEWDKAWAASDRLIKRHPEDPNGWIIRAFVQHDQPRAGLQDTVAYFVAHFGRQPDQRMTVMQMKAMLREDDQR